MKKLIKLFQLLKMHLQLKKFKMLVQLILLQQTETQNNGTNILAESLPDELKGSVIDQNMVENKSVIDSSNSGSFINFKWNLIDIKY